MSKLDELIAEFCPDGVEYIELKELFNTRNGYTPSKSKSEYWANGDVPWFRMEDIRENGNILSDSIQHVNRLAVKGDLFPADSIIIATSATIGEHALITVPSLANQRFTYLMLKAEYKKRFYPKFLFYYCYKLDVYCLQNLNQSSFASVDMKKFVRFKFPIPHLEVQREIVRILDNYTELTAELTVELTAELTARRKQYEYYRNKLLTYDVKAAMMPLGSVAARISSGKNKERSDDGKFPVYGSTGIISRTNNAIYDKEQILVARVGANAGFVHLADGQYDVSDNTLIVDVKPEYLLKYVYYSMMNMNLNQYAKGGGQPLITAGDLKRLSIPMPEYEDQIRIVKLLDNFDAICSNLNIRLSAETNARQKQYEFYRDQLLTFVESGSSILTDRA